MQSQRAGGQFIYSPHVFSIVSCHNKIPQTGCRKQQNFSHISRCWKFEVRVTPMLGSGESSLPSLGMATFWLCRHMAERKKEREIFSFFLFLIRPQILSNQNLTLMTSFSYYYLLKSIFPNTVTLRVKVSTCIFGRGT